MLPRLSIGIAAKATPIPSIPETTDIEKIAESISKSSIFETDSCSPSADQRFS